MKKLLFIFLAAALVFGCQKKEAPSVQKQGEVVFGISKVEPVIDLKSTAEWPECPENMEPAYASITIDGFDDPFTPEVFELNGQLYTQAIKLDAPEEGTTTYTVTNFLLYNADDEIIMATPAAGSDFAEYTDPDVSFTFDVSAFEKNEVPVEVLCFIPENYEFFGFTWFNITEIVVREFCFFGDICLNDDPWSPDDYMYSLYDYAQQPPGTQNDMPAIFMVHVYGPDGEVPNSPFTNAAVDAGYGAGSPLCVQYPDKLNAQEELFTFDVYILVRNAAGSFSYQPYYTFYSTDDGVLMLDDNTTPADNDENGVVEFVLGSCNSSSTDLLLDWLTPMSTIIVHPGDMALDYSDVSSDPSKWFFYNDQTDVIDNSLGSFVASPGINGSVQISVTGEQRRNLATYQFAGLPLASITTLAFSTYNPSAGNGGSDQRSGYLNFNVEFYGTDVWQNRLAYIPSHNGTVVQDSWQEWDCLQGGTALWWWSGFEGNGNQWPDGNTNEYRTWSDLMTAFPNARVRVADPWMGIRVGEPYNSGYTENIDSFKIATGGTTLVFNFDN